MGPNSRPPLTSRIRASFDGKRSRSSQGSSSQDIHVDPLGAHPTNGHAFITQDPDSLRAAIDAAINSETFQTAIAANLAKLINPNITTALDTIQPLVEAVYAHEVLLRKTNRSVEDILDRVDGGVISRRTSRIESDAGSRRESRFIEDDGGEATPTAEGFRPKSLVHDAEIVATSPAHNLEELKKLLDENNAKTAATLSELSSSVEASNSKIAAISQGITDINASLHPTREIVDTLKSHSEQSTTVIAVIQGQLDQMKDDIGGILNEVTTLKVNLNMSTDFNADSFGKLSTAISAIITTIEGHSSTLAEIKDKEPHPEILGALQRSNEHHTAHAIVLGDLKERSLVPAGSGPDHTAAFEGLKSDLASLKEHIEAGLTSNNDNVSSLNSKVDTHHENIRSLVVAPVAAGKEEVLQAKISDIKGALDAHSALLEGIKTSHVAHASALESQVKALEEMKGWHASHSVALEEVKTAGAAHSETLMGHGDTIRSLNSTAASRVPPALDHGALEAQIAALAATLETQTLALDEIGTAHSNHTAALEEVKNASAAHLEALTSHGVAIRGLNSGSSPTVATTVDTSAVEAQITALATTLEAHTSALDDIKASLTTHASALDGHSAALDDIKATTISHSQALDEAKAGQTETTAAPTVDNSKLESIGAHIGDIVLTLGAQTTVLNQIAAHKDVLEEIKSTGGEIKRRHDSHAATLGEIKDSHTAHAATLAELKGLSTSHSSALESSRSLPDATASSDPALIAQLSSLASTLSTHTSHLEHLKSNLPAGSTTPKSPVSAASMATDNLLATVILTLENHTTMLTEIKDDVSAEILTSLHDLGQASSNHTNLLTEIREADLSDEILTLLHASNESHAGAEAKLDAINAVVTKISEWEVEGGLGILDEKITELEKRLDEYHSTLSSVKETTYASHGLHAPHAGALDGLKATSVDSAPAANTSALDEKIAGVVAKMNEHHAALSTMHAAHSSSLDEIKTRSVETSAAVDTSALDRKFSALAAKIDEHHAALFTLHAAHTSSLDDIKSRPVEAPTDTSSLEDKLANIASKLDDHQTLLTSIKETTSTSHGLHLAQAYSISDLQSRSPTSPSDPAALEEKLDSVQHTLDAHHATLASLQDLATASQEWHADHTTALNEIQEASLSSVGSHTSHASVLEQIKQMASMSNEAHSSHMTTLGEIKEGNVAHAVSLKELQTKGGGEVKEPGSPDFAGMESHLKAVIETLEAQTGTLAQIKDTTAITPEILAQVQASHGILASHTTLLGGTKTGLDEHGALVKDLHTSTKEFHGGTKEKHESLLSGLAGLAVGGAAGAGGAALLSDDDKEVLAELKSIREIVIKTSTVVQTTNRDITSMKSQLEINHTTLTTSITTLSDELKAEIDATGTEITDHLSELSSEVKAINISKGMHLNPKGIEQLQQHIELPNNGEGTHLSPRGLTQLEAHLAHLTSPDTTKGTHFSAHGLNQLSEQLQSGVHLNATGISQLQDHFSTGSEAGEAVDEGSWFSSQKKAVKGGIAGSAVGLVSQESLLETVHEEDEESPKETEFRKDIEQGQEEGGDGMEPYSRDQVDVFKYLDPEKEDDGEKVDHEGVGARVEGHLEGAEGTDHPSKTELHTVASNESHSAPDKEEEEEPVKKAREPLQNWSIVDKEEEDPFADGHAASLVKEDSPTEKPTLKKQDDDEDNHHEAKVVARGKEKNADETESDKENEKANSSPAVAKDVDV